MQERDAKPRRNSFGVGAAVLLLVTSGLALPLSSFGAAAVSAISVPAVAPGAAVMVAHPAAHLQGRAVLDGVASAFVVAPPSIEGSHQMDEFGVFELPPAAGIMAGGPDGDAVVHKSLHTQRLGFAPGSPEGQGQGASAPWSPSGAVLRGGFGGEMMLVPAPTSATSSLTAAVPKVWWDFFQRRSKFEIFIEILELMKRGPMTPFEVAFYARLNHKRTKEYTEFLAEAGYLQPANEEGRVLYALTNDGLGFLDRAHSLLAKPGIIEVAGRGYQRDF